jgi:hypothetical protein
MVAEVRKVDGVTEAMSDTNIVEQNVGLVLS